jgi:threonylcarbamoyladenosine tRNA methylthiotransferase MtaB
MPEELSGIRGIRWVVGNAFKKDIVSIIESGRTGIFHAPLTTGDIPPVVFHTCLDTPAAKKNRTRFHLKIQEGCALQCSYCIVPQLRGPSRSLPHGQVLETGERAILAGYKEIVITGTHIGQYKSGAGYGLIDLVNDMVRLSGEYRIRLSSLDPRECTDELLGCIGKEPKLCKHLHLSVQSFSQPVLERMNRRYHEYDAFLERMAGFRAVCPDAGIGGDFIVGFPGETREMFETTLNAVATIGFSYGHVFRFSPRPLTAAARMDGLVDERVKTDRGATLRACLQKLRVEFIGRQLGTTTHTIIVEREVPAGGMTSNYIRVEIPGTRMSRNTWQEVVCVAYNQEKNCCIAKTVIQ